MTRYCLGFAFSLDKSHILLIRKNRPDWQAGFLNGVGGKIEKDEVGVDAMCREFREETGVGTSPEQWHLVAVLGGPSWLMEVFSTTGDISRATSKTDEEVQTHPIDHLPESLVHNLRWLIPLCLDTKSHPLFVSHT